MLSAPRRRRPVGCLNGPSVSRPRVTLLYARVAAQCLFFSRGHRESHVRAPLDTNHKSALQIRPADERSFRSGSSVGQSSFPGQTRWETDVKYHKPACAISLPPIRLSAALLDRIHGELVSRPRDRGSMQHSASRSRGVTQHPLAATLARSIVSSIRTYSGTQKTSHTGLTLSGHRETAKWKHARTARLRSGCSTDSSGSPESRGQPEIPVYRSFCPSSFSSYPSCLRAITSSPSASICLGRALRASLALSRFASVRLWRGASSCTVDSLSRAKARKKDRPLRRDTSVDTIEDPCSELSETAAARRLREIWTLHRLRGVCPEQDLRSPGPVRAFTQTGLGPRLNDPDANTAIVPPTITASAVSEGQEVTRPVHINPAGTWDGVSGVRTPSCNISAGTILPVSSSPTSGTKHLTADSEQGATFTGQLADSERERRIPSSSSRREALFERYGPRNSAGTKGQPTRQRGVVVKVHRHSVCGFIAPEDGGPEIFVHRDDFIEPSPSTEDSPAPLFISRRETPQVGNESHQQHDDWSSKNVGRRRHRSGKSCSDQTEKGSVEEGTLGGRAVESKPIQLRVGQLLSFEAAWDGRHNAPKAVRVVSLEEFGI